MQSSNGIGQSQDTSGNTSAPAQTTSPPLSPAPTTDERVFKQSEVNEIVKKAKHGAVEDYRRLSTERPDYVEQKYSHTDIQQPQRTFQYPQTPSPTETDIRRLAGEEAQRLRDQWQQEARTKSEAEHAQRTVSAFWNKISPGKDKYQDFDKVTGDIQLARFPNVVQLLADYVDNADDVLYDLGKDRSKMATLEQLAYMSPSDAIVQAQRLSQSLKDNNAASKIKVPNEPLSQMRPSNTGTDNGVLSVKDYRARYKV